MIINREQLMQTNNFLQHLVIQGLTNTLKTDREFGDWIETNWNKKKKINIKLTIENQEIDIEKFCDHWQVQVEKMIKEQAVELIKEKFVNIYNIMNDLESYILTKMEK